MRDPEQPFDLLITDETMPGMSGSALCQATKALRPTLFCVLCTGAAEDLGTAKRASACCDDLLAKPEGLKGPKGLDSGPKKPYETLLPSLSVKPTSISVRIKSMTSPVDGV